ncbi:MAG: hypothetical protein ACK5PZ_06160, partial [Pirellula sp.]
KQRCHQCDAKAIAHSHQSNQTWPNQTWPKQTSPKQTWPKQTWRQVPDDRRPQHMESDPHTMSDGLVRKGRSEEGEE